MSKSMNNDDARLVFDESARDFVLQAFGKTVDDSGYIVEAGNTSKRVQTIDGQEIKKEQFAGVRKGSEIYIKSDITSLIDMCDDIRSKKQANDSLARKS